VKPLAHLQVQNGISHSPRSLQPFGQHASTNTAANSNTNAVSALSSIGNVFHFFSSSFLASNVF
jgi:hypothetical protein